MPDNSNLRDLLTNAEISSGERISALVGIQNQIMELTKLAVSSLTVKDHTRLFVAERLHTFGTIVIDPLHKLYATSADEDLHFHIAILLLKLGDLSYVDIILNALINKSHPDDICFIANSLAKAKVIEASNLLIDILVSANSLDEIICLISAIRILDVEIPSEIVNKICSDMRENTMRVELQDFSTISISIEIITALGCSLDKSIVTRLSQNDSNKRLLATFGYS